MGKTKFLCTLLFCLWPIISWGQTYKSSNISAATYPNYGCDSWDRTYDGTYYTETRLSGASPSGNDAVRIAMIANATPGEDKWGCGFTSGLPVISQGSTVYLRYRVRINNPVAWRANYPSDGGSGVFNKTLILGDNCEAAPYSPTRMITGFNSHSGESFALPYLYSKQNIGPGISDFIVSTDTWLNVQIKIVSSTTSGASDGSISVYINNNTEGSPTQTSSGIQIKTVGWDPTGCASSNIKWGDGNWRSLSTTGSQNASVDYADFVYSSAFDTGWYITGGPTQSGTRLRVRGADMSILALGIPIAMLLRRGKL